MSFLKLNKKSIFLFDGIGAATSFLSTGFVLPIFSRELGLTPQTLFFLAMFPFMYMLYSLYCFIFVREIKSWMLMAIVIANFLYCFVSGAIFHFDIDITLWGKLLLLIEIAIVAIVIHIELKIYKQSFNLQN